MVEEALQWLGNHREDESPFYINIWFHEPHKIEAAPDSLKNRHIKNQAYYGCIENMDYAVGKLMKFLTENNMDENTIIIFTSDNGLITKALFKPDEGVPLRSYEVAMNYIESTTTTKGLAIQAFLNEKEYQSTS